MTMKARTTRPLPGETVPASTATDDGRTPSTPVRVAVVGATGFVGSATVTALASAGIHCTAVARTPSHTEIPGVVSARATLADPASLERALIGADVVIHAASYTGNDPAQCVAVNVEGTENLLAAAARNGIDQVIYVSTIGVYGSGPHSGIGEFEAAPAPVSALSASRLTAEHRVLERGGCVVRPGFVHGHGDRWFVPGFTRILETLGAWVDEGRSRISIIAVNDLARLLAGLAAQSPARPGDVFHACHPDPVSVRELGQALADSGRLRLPATSLTFDEAVTAGARHGLTERHLDLIGRDHWYDPARLWTASGVGVGVGALHHFPSRR
ncbi:nucleoside-diphosphate-sugar epimerase [Rhodococcus wratislaviensis]|uniref:NAD-dependent epimerase/dehydratase family protein, 3-beta hydroxysteroid dehydrogenase/isomerase family protein n=1 Tax=Rhodococcus wratislaviensis TaxID=44752 RepID=A0AB38FCK8_RHOWR|nr:NAD(P)-dependent oxidoreductase [Rhodococcus wratislaviensis]REE73838.1 nucleoside-diphosphate-sugar epimerase [Rhodococcus wratislaviensis]SPZ39062.1 NAD-dependent epimerase/dehydratase family protein, 3-beta hydroxysteroid dehydrogenase/isomerase family protein [Rhodococcus wratislaviensis]